jgi:predicted amidophosphoribosyltransferase
MSEDNWERAEGPACPRCGNHVLWISAISGLCRKCDEEGQAAARLQETTCPVCQSPAVLIDGRIICPNCKGGFNELRDDLPDDD